MTSRSDMQATAFGHVRGRRGSNGVPKYHAIKAVAEALDLSPRTVRRWIANGDLVVHRVAVSSGSLRTICGRS